MARSVMEGGSSKAAAARAFHTTPKTVAKWIARFALYAERNLIERFFPFIKQFRGIATRYEKTARNLLAGLHLVCALAWLK